MVIWDLDLKEAVHQAVLPKSIDPSEAITAVSVLTGDSVVVVGARSGQMYVWDTARDAGLQPIISSYQAAVSPLVSPVCVQLLTPHRFGAYPVGINTSGQAQQAVKYSLGTISSCFPRISKL